MKFFTFGRWNAPSPTKKTSPTMFWTWKQWSVPFSGPLPHHELNLGHNFVFSCWVYNCPTKDAFALGIFASNLWRSYLFNLLKLYADGWWTLQIVECCLSIESLMLRIKVQFSGANLVIEIFHHQFTMSWSEIGLELWLNLAWLTWFNTVYTVSKQWLTFQASQHHCFILFSSLLCVCVIWIFS